MAHETLKATIRQYIGPNGQNSITGQIMQDILIAMVNEYPDITGYATQSWVTTQLGGYLPLTGGNVDGNLSIYDTMNIYSSSIEWNDNGDYCRINFDDDGITVTAHGTGYVIANEFIRNGGTSSQFLKADGSVDSNTYALSSALVNYLPKTGGTVTGDVVVTNLDYDYSYLRAGSLNVESSRPNIDFTTHGDPDSYETMITLNEDGILEFEGDVSEFKFYGTVYASQFSNISDMRKKDVVGDVPLNLYNVANAPLFKFTWKDEKKSSGEQIGTAAQYWQNVLPELVSIGRDADMTLSMQYDVTALACAITVAKTVVDHEERIKNLESKILS